MDRLCDAARKAGAHGAAVIPRGQIVLSDTFRDICQANQCGNFGRCWMCPPQLPPIEEAMARVRSFTHALVYQSVFPLEDSFDVEGMFAAARSHARLSQRLRTALEPLLPGPTLHLTCGGCHLCDRCAKMDGLPCRRPEQALPSLEGYGIDVYNTVKDTPLRYINGKNTVTYFGMVLFTPARLTLHLGERTEVLPFLPPASAAEVLSAAGVHVPQPCGGRGKCGKCAAPMEGALSPASGPRLLCQTVLLGDAAISLPAEQALEQIETDRALRYAAPDPMEGSLGAAVDIGTTTLALTLLRPESGEVLAAAACENPQTAVAADVIGRIAAAMDGRADYLRSLLLNALDRLLAQACAEAEEPAEAVEVLVLTGNTTMLYLLTGRNPEPLSHAPFRADCLFGCDAEILGRRTWLPPCMNAFVGADITCAMLSAGVTNHETPVLLCDIGTNGEIALWRDGKLFVTSTAAGPAFEGAGISCGCGSIPGAIDRVWAENGALRCRTIGGVSAAGLCGSGLIDAVAALLELGWINETGAAEEALLPLSGGVALLPRDIRAVQLAKAAIAAGIQTLLEVTGTRVEEITDFYICGGFGAHLDLQNAAAIGLFPGPLKKKAHILGNAALRGAAELLLDRRKQSLAQALAAAAVHVDLGGNPRFNHHYIEQMLFPEQEDVL